MPAHLDRELPETIGQPGLERGASGGPVDAGVRQKRLAKGDPDRDAAAGTPKTEKNVNPVAAHYDTGYDRRRRHLRKPGDAGTHGSALEHRAGAVADATLRKHADRMPGAQAAEGHADGLAVKPSMPRSHAPKRGWRKSSIMPIQSILRRAAMASRGGSKWLIWLAARIHAPSRRPMPGRRTWTLTNGAKTIFAISRERW